MLKCLFATCLTALSVNTQPLAVSPSLEPSSAISEGTTFNVGDIYMLSVDFTIDNPYPDSTTSLPLFYQTDSGIDTLKLINFNIPIDIEYSTQSSYPSISTFDACDFAINTSLTNYISVLYFDNFDDNLDFAVNVNPSRAFTYTATFEILEGFEGFNESALPYITKVEKPYTPPAKSNLYRLLYDFYYSIFNDDDLTAITTGYNMPFDNWLAHTCTIATLITLIVVAFFFLRWLFRVISGLVLLKR